MLGEVGERRPEGKRPHNGSASAAGEQLLHERVYALLANAVEDGALAAGAVVRESVVMKLLDVTRAPVRQAFGRLRDEGRLRRDGQVGHVVVGSGLATPHDVDLNAVLGRFRRRTPFRRMPAWTRVYDAIERAVIHRAAFGRARINELELSRHFDVGRAPARDALMRLELLGMLKRDAGSHWSIVALDADRVRDLNEVRQQLEPLALRASHKHLKHDQLLAMRKRLSGAHLRYPMVDPAEMNELENDLHFACLSRCPNTELLGALGRTRCVLTLSKHVLGTAMPIPAEDPFLSEHMAVFDCLVTADVLAAEERLRKHIASATPKVVERLAAFRKACTPPELSFFRL